MIDENKRLISIYNCGIEYLEELCPQGINLSKYFIVKKVIISINDINARLCNSLQNRNQMPRIIKFDTNRITLNEILYDFEPNKVIDFYDEQSLFSRFKEVFKINNADSPRNLWLQYSKFVLSASQFMSRFETAEQFDEFIKNFSKNDLTRAALPMLLSKEIAGLGFALACDFLKELGYSEYPKPDVHLNTIFNQLDICANDDYEVYKAIIRMAEACGKTAYHVDKVFWLISSGRYYLDGIEVKGKRTEFIDKVKNIEKMIGSNSKIVETDHHKEQMVERLIWICNPENIRDFVNESEYIELTNSIAIEVAGWDCLGQYSDYAELSGRVIENNAENSEKIDLNTCIATLICVHREQHFNSSDIIGPRIKSGDLLKLTKRVKELIF